MSNGTRCFLAPNQYKFLECINPYNPQFDKKKATWYLTEALENFYNKKQKKNVYSLINAGFLGHFLRQIDLREYIVSPFSDLKGDQVYDSSFQFEVLNQ